MRRLTIVTSLVLALSLLLAACGGSESDASLETVSASEAAEILNSNAGVVVLDIRTPEETAQGVIEGATFADFYDTDFADQLDALDKDTSYVVYCRSGNRSGQSMSVFEELGFSDVTEIDGGIVSWASEGLPIVLP